MWNVNAGWWAVPLVYGLAAALAGSRLASTRRCWDVGVWAARANVCIAAAHGFVARRSDAPAFVVLLLVTVVGASILGFSRRYLDGERGQPRFVRWFLATVCAATLLVGSHNLIVLSLAWTATSVALHQLLSFHEERAEARAVAHKKFLMSRFADLALYSAVGLLWQAFGTTDIDALRVRLEAAAEVPWAAHLAGVLLVLAVVIRSAQLPFHGWLIQVMEAPTPVSALLHAGVVNMGGFVMIRLAGLMVRLEGARGLLVVVGALTALLAGLVMTTRVSVKVALAWSTCAQMGFMLLECGLGAYSLALLHLVAHSVYKAHAFLASGRLLFNARATAGTAVPPPSGVVGSGVAALVSVAATGALYMVVAAALGLPSIVDPGTETPLLLVALSLTPLYLGAVRAKVAWQRLVVLAMGLGLTMAYMGWHSLARNVVDDGAPAPTTLRVGVLFGFLASWAVQVVIARWPAGRLARWLYPVAYAGFYLDDAMTWALLRLAPPRPGPCLPSAELCRFAERPAS